MEIKRAYYVQQLVDLKHNGLIKVVTGVRRCGKSYLLFKLFRDHLKACGVSDTHIIEIDLENRRNADLCNPDALIRHIDSLMIDKAMYYIMLDEVQNVREFESVLNSYLKIPNADLYVTGNNSRFLSKDIITEFRGRGFEIRIHPLSFMEYMSVYEGNQYDGLQEYMLYGGMPQILTLPHRGSKESYLKQLFVTTYLRDVKERNGIRYDADLEELLDMLASNIGNLTNPTRLANSFNSVKKSNITYNTIKNYIACLQDAFLIEKSVRYDIKGNRYIDTPSKYYFEDLGLRNARLDFRQIDEGHLMENLLYNELRSRGYTVDVGQVGYSYKDEQGCSQRSHLEVDFVCNRGDKRLYVQSAYDLRSAEKWEQEKRSLRHIRDGFQKILVCGTKTPTHHNNEGILITNILDFLQGGIS